MRDKITKDQANLRAAIRAQKELGTNQVILPRRRSSNNGSTAVGNGKAINKLMSPGTITSSSLSKTYSSLEEHREAIQHCRACPLWETRTNFVYGVGNPKAELMFIGEAPGAEEDKKGEPFVGAAGKLLDKILESVGFERDKVYISNILKSRPPNNRDPLPHEVQACFPHLEEQIRLIQPKIICCLGRISAQILLQTKGTLTSIRGVFHNYRDGILLMATYHPAALLRYPQYKRDTWEDMKMLKAKFDELTQGK